MRQTLSMKFAATAELLFPKLFGTIFAQFYSPYEVNYDTHPVDERWVGGCDKKCCVIEERETCPNERYLWLVVAQLISFAHYCNTRRLVDKEAILFRLKSIQNMWDFLFSLLDLFFASGSTKKLTTLTEKDKAEVQWRHTYSTAKINCLYSSR